MFGSASGIVVVCVFGNRQPQPPGTLTRFTSDAAAILLALQQ